MNIVSRAMVRRLWGGPHVRWYSMLGEGASGGILILWDSKVLEVMDSCVGNLFTFAFI